MNPSDLKLAMAFLLPLYTMYALLLVARVYYQDPLHTLTMSFASVRPAPTPPTLI